MQKALYLAYGSNLNIEQMAHRCPTAKVVGATAFNDHLLLFRGPRSSAVATVGPCKGESVPVLVWEITPADEDALDRYEGWPYFYRKEKVKVMFDGNSISAMIYIMNEGRPLGTPGCYYYSIILDGYKAAGFNENILRKAVNDSVGVERK